MAFSKATPEAFRVTLFNGSVTIIDNNNSTTRSLRANSTMRTKQSHRLP